MITDEFVKGIPEDFHEGVMYISNHFNDFYTSFNYELPLEHFEEFVEYLSLMEAYLASNSYDFQKVLYGGDKKEYLSQIRDFIYVIKSVFEKIHTNKVVFDSKERFRRMFNVGFYYEFSEGDLGILQKLVNELRDIISKSELFTAEHKQRILRRLEKLQGELHKKVSDLDRFWGLIGDAGVAIGKFGSDAKPIVDRIKEIADIVWRTQARTEELPSGTDIPFLETGKDDSRKTV